MMCCRKRTCVALVRYGEVRLRRCALLPAEWRVGEHDIELRRGANEQPAVHLVLRQRVAVPDVRMVDAVENQVRQPDRVDQVLLLPAPERLVLQLRDRGAGDSRAGLRLHVLSCLGQKSAGAAARVVHRLADLRVDGAYHRADHLARREELAGVRALLAHLEEQPLVDLAEREHVRGVDALVGDLVDLVEHVEQVLLGVDPHFLDAGHDLGDHLLPWRRAARSFSFFRYGISSAFTNFMNAPDDSSSSSLRLFGFASARSSGAAQSFHR